MTTRPATVSDDDREERRRYPFSFGLWTVGNPGRDPFGEPTRDPLDPVATVERLAKLGASGVSLHDNDLVPFGTSLNERNRIVARFVDALARCDMRVTMATTNLFTHPAFKDGAFTSNDRTVRRAAIAKAAHGIDLGAELGAPIYVFWGGREGTETTLAKPIGDALERYREALDFLCEYVRDRGYAMRFAIEPKPNEPRGELLLPTVGHALHFITTLEQPEMVGVNPEVAHETMAGLSIVNAVSLALWVGKLFHIDLNAQRIGRYDQDFRFGAEDLKESFGLVHLLESTGWSGTRHFDAHAYRSEDLEGVWRFADGCMRTYVTLAHKSQQLASSLEIAEALSDAGVDHLTQPTVGAYSSARRDELLAEQHDLDALSARGYGNERLDQLVVELLLGSS